MKKCIDTLLLSSLFLFILCGCNHSNEDLVPSSNSPVNQFEDITLFVNEETVTPTGLTLSIQNDSDKEYTYGEAYKLEQKLDGEWYTVPIATEDDYGFIEIGYILAPHTSNEQVIDWEWLYGRLNPGEYRLIKEMLAVHEAGEYETLPLAAEFTIQ